MTIHTAPTNQKNTQLWSVPQILLASYIAGPIGGCYFLGKNYDELGYLRYSRKSYLIGIAGTILLLTLLFLIPENLIENIPRTMIPLAYASFISSFAQTYQKKLIEEKINEGGKRFSYWWCFLMILSLVVIQIPLIFLFGFIFATTF